MSSRAARLWCTALLLILAASAAARGAAAWPLGGPSSDAPRLAQAATFLTGLLLGWLLPGLPLTLLAGAPARLFWPRALGLGTGYVLLTSGAYAAGFGHLPPRAVQLGLLALPCLAALVRPLRPAAISSRALGGALGGACLVVALLWPKLVHEGLNGDGTESYELARSLSAHVLPHWDMERPDGDGRFGIPAVNPFITNSYLAGVRLTLMGPGEVAVRLTVVGALLAAFAIAVSLAPVSVGAPAWIYAFGLTAVHALWGAYYVGYERAFTDLAEPLGTNTLMVALWLAGLAEIVRGSAALGVSFLLLAAGVLYSAPVLATVALGALALRGVAAGRRALGLWIASGAALAAIVVLVGLASGDLGDWIRQVRSEYWNDFVDQARRTPTLPMLGLLALATGGLPLVAAARWRRLSTTGQALLATSAVYLLLVAASRYKNLHYLAPLPFLLAGPSIEATSRRLQVVGGLVVAATFALSWPRDRAIHRENVELGALSCLDGLDIPTAALGSAVVYDAFQAPGPGARFGIGKHTFVRYAADLGGEERCAFRLSAAPPAGWIAVASRPEPPALTFSTRDVEAYVQWRFQVPPVPSSLLFPAPVRSALPREAGAWTGRLRPAVHEGALLVDGFRPEPPDSVGVRRWPLRLLVAAARGDALRWRRWAPEGGHALGLRVNGADASPASLAVPPGWSEGTITTTGVGWQRGWNLLELTAARPEAPLTIEWLEMNAVRGATEMTP